MLLAVALTLTSFFGEDKDEYTIYFLIVVFLIAQLFYAFGVAAILIGVRNICNRDKWFTSLIKRSWAKTLWYTTIFWFLTTGVALIAWLIGWSEK